MADEVVVLDVWASAFGCRVRIALAEKGVEYEYKEENLADKSPLLLKSNPVHKKIPVLIHDGRPICESLIILEYIDEAWKHKAAPLMPQDPYQRANARFWADFTDKKIPDCGSRIWRNKGHAREAATKEFIENLKLLEGELGEKSYFGGESFGFMDIVLISYYSWFYTYETHGNFAIEKECPKLMVWINKCKERDSVSKTFAVADPHRVYEYVAMLKKKLGIE
eukprot:TRINITY_DN41384_c0_g2_i1.p1 TRINITY_DN41384_c0_g2~~TRINITY_DN41384_c0_g2_i1.p1  ORF type:complete len:223 (+),score=43.91 TRINITY_DN41384_c0_g2_i1:83-751(+)